MNKTDINTVYEVKQAKKIAKKLQKASTEALKLMHYQDVVAKNKGYNNWHHFITTIKNNLFGSDNNSLYFYETDSIVNHDKNAIFFKKENNKFQYIKNTAIKNNIFIQSKHNKFQLNVLFNSIENNKSIIYLDGTNNLEQIKETIKKSKLFYPDRPIRLYAPFNLLSSIPKELNPYKSSFNPFVTGSANELTYLVLSLMHEVTRGSDFIWKNKATLLISSVLKALVYMRDKKEVLLSASKISEYLSLDKIRILSKRRDLPKDIHNSIFDYFHSLPGYKENHVQQQDIFLEHHGHLQMQFIKLLGNLNQFIETHILEEHSKPVDYFDFKKPQTVIFLFPDFNNLVDEMKILSYFVLSSIKMYYSNLFMSGETIFKNNQPDLFINNCPLPGGWSVASVQLKSLKVGATYNYFSKIKLDEELKCIKANCRTNIIIDSDFELYSS